MKAVVIPAGSKTPAKVNITGGYKELQKYVDGLIEGVSGMNNGVFISGYVNEEGLINGLEFNPIASILFGRYLCGPCVLCGEVDDEGNDTDVTTGQMAMLQWVWNASEAHREFVEDRTEIMEKQNALIL